MRYHGLLKVSVDYLDNVNNIEIPILHQPNLILNTPLFNDKFEY